MHRTIQHVALATAGLIVAASAFALPALAQEPTSGSITVSVRLGPTAPPDVDLQLLRDGTTDVWPGCEPGIEDTIECSDLPTGEYTFATTSGLTIAPDCIWEGVNGSFYPIRLGSNTVDYRSTWNWDCTVWIGEPGVLVGDSGRDLDLEPATITFDDGSAACRPQPNDLTWCTAPSFGTWTFEPPAAIPDGSDFTVVCRPVGYYEPGAPPPTPSPVVTTSSSDPLWFCEVLYPTVFLRWSVIADTGSPDAELATAPWSLLDLDREVDVSDRCVPVDELEPGELAAHRCEVDTGRYSLVVDGLDSPYALHGCEEVQVLDATYCSVTDRMPTTFEYLLQTWSAASETWPDAVRVAPVGPGEEPPECSTINDSRSEESGRVYRERQIVCTRLLPGTYRSEVAGAPVAVAVERSGECDDVELLRGSFVSCSLQIRTVDIAPGEPDATLPPTGARPIDGVALWAALTLALGTALLAAVRLGRRPATGRGGAAGR